MSYVAVNEDHILSPTLRLKTKWATGPLCVEYGGPLVGELLGLILPWRAAPTSTF